MWGDIMRCLTKNKRPFYYYLYHDKKPIVDADGNKTGEYTLLYHRGVECHGNISAGSGDAQTELFGNNIRYEKVIVIDDPNCPIDENTVLCIDIKPCPYSDVETPKHDYIVKAVAKSLNSVSIAISKVGVNEDKSRPR